jgi:hypothetical protein
MCDKPNHTLPLTKNLSNQIKTSSFPGTCIFASGQSAFRKVDKLEKIKKPRSNNKIINLKKIRKNQLLNLRLDHNQDKCLVDKLFDSLIFNSKVKKTSLIL